MNHLFRNKPLRKIRLLPLCGWKNTRDNIFIETIRFSQPQRTGDAAFYAELFHSGLTAKKPAGSV
jgi:hypothetical protein